MYPNQFLRVLLAATGALLTPAFAGQLSRELKNVAPTATMDVIVQFTTTPTATSGKLMFADGRAMTIGAGAVAGEQK